MWGAQPKDRYATLGIALGREYIGRGYGTDAMRVIVSYGFREMGLHRIQLGVAPFNPAGIRAYEKAGFVHDEGIMQTYGARYARCNVAMLYLPSAVEPTQAAPR